MNQTQMRNTVTFVPPPRRSLLIPAILLIVGAVVVGIGFLLAVGEV